MCLFQVSWPLPHGPTHCGWCTPQVSPCPALLVVVEEVWAQLHQTRTWSGVGRGMRCCWPAPCCSTVVEQAKEVEREAKEGEREEEEDRKKKKKKKGTAEKEEKKPAKKSVVGAAIKKRLEAIRAA